jgi:hypothetical protein
MKSSMSGCAPVVFTSALFSIPLGLERGQTGSYHSSVALGFLSHVNPKSSIWRMKAFGCDWGKMLASGLDMHENVRRAAGTRPDIAVQLDGSYREGVAIFATEVSTFGC